jgi:hypothetical protein
MLRNHAEAQVLENADDYIRATETGRLTFLEWSHEG